MKIIHLFVIAVIAMFMFGCAASQQTVKNSGSDANNAASDNSNTADTPSKTTPPKPADTTKSLKDVLSKKLVKYTADYKIVASGETTLLTMAFDLPKFAMISKATAAESISIFDSTKFIVCTKQDADWTCMKLDVPSNDALATENSINDGTYKPVYVGTCSVAGETGSKYEFSAENGDKTTIRYTSDGIMLETVTKESTMTATKVSRSVDANLFVPPAEPQDLAAQIPTGYGMPG